MKTYLLGFSLGALVVSSSLAWLYIALPFFLVVASFYSKRVFTFGLMALLGASWVLVNLEVAADAALDVDVKPYRDTIEGQISHVTYKPNKVEFDFLTLEGKLKASCYRCQLSLSDGDRWRLVLRLKPILNLYNPDGFNYRKWMISKGYAATASIDSKALLNQKLYGEGATLRHLVSSIVSVQRTPILRALLLGDKSGLKAEDQRLINRVGISHLFVVSGLHISLAALLVVMLLAWLQRPLLIFNWRYSQVVALVLGLGIAVLYGYLSGMNTPAIRALIMLVCAFFVLWGKQNISAFVYWQLALIFVLLVSPLAFLNLGAWLSFGIVLALIMGMSGLDERTEKELVKCGHLKVFWRNLKRYSFGLLRAQWFAFCAGGVILVAFNVPVSPISFVLNLMLIPLVSLILVPLAFLGVVVGVLGDTTLLLCCEQIITSFIQFMHEAKGLMIGPLSIHDENRYLIVSAFVLFLFPRALRVYPLGVVIILLALSVSAHRSAVGGFNLLVFDVGQGSSALIRTRTHSILVDTGYGRAGSLGMSDYIVLPYLRKSDVTSLDKVFLTHDDADHAGGVEALKPMLKAVTRQSNCPEEKWIWDEVSFHQFQSPDYMKGNNGTCLLKVKSKSGASVLFAGDIEKKAERSLIKHYTHLLDSDVLVVPHHGSKTSSSSGFLEAVNPAIGIISAGRLNHFGHPHSEVVGRYQERLVKIYSTGSHGAVEVEFSPRQAARIVSTYRPKDQYE